jgi:hypothetical protein
MKRMRRIGTGLALLAILPLASACFGSFGLTRKVYGFNSRISQDKWGREGVFLLLNIPFIPVYGLATMFDSLFFNSVEFWTGETLIAADSERPRNREFRNDYSEPEAPALPASSKQPPAKSKKPRK